MSTVLRTAVVGTPLARRDALVKVTGTAPYATEHAMQQPAYMHAVQATVARGEITGIAVAGAADTPGVLAVLTHVNAARLQGERDPRLWILQDGEIHYRGQFVAAVVAETAEAAREAADRIRVSYAARDHDVVLRADRDDLYRPEKVNPNSPPDTDQGDLDAAMRDAPVTIDRVYTTPMEHQNPMEPHATTAIWDGAGLTLYDSTQGAHSVAGAIAPLFGLGAEQVHVIAPYVGGGFGSKGEVHSHVVLACMGAQAVAGRPVRFALTRQQMFSVVGYRGPMIQRIRLAADREGRLAAIANDVVEQTARGKDYAEQTGVATRMMYAAANRRTSHRMAALDVPHATWFRAPGECPGMFAPEVAFDELAGELGIDPIELRIRNEPDCDPETGKPWSSRRLVECLRAGAERFGWHPREALPGARRDGEWLVGTGVASAVYPVNCYPGSEATVVARNDGGYTVRIGATDIGTGAWTALAMIAADALEVPLEQVHLEIGDSRLPTGTVAGGSSGTANWGSAIVAAAERFRDEHGDAPQPGDESTGGTPENTAEDHYALYAFGAQFAEARVSAVTGEVRVPRMLAVFDAGRIINPTTARSQFRGGMIMGLGMALLEQSVLDPRFGHVVNHDLAEYHVPVNADVVEISAHWLDGADPHVNAMGAKGIGEIGIVGAAAAIANAVHHATSVRIRDLPITPDRLLPHLL